RIIRHPLIHSGHIELQVCTVQGVQHITVTRRHGAVWRQARASEWGDGWDIDHAFTSATSSDKTNG
ncbi:MAG: rRNA methyltransferase, partial [Chloroflexus aggregans]